MTTGQKARFSQSVQTGGGFDIGAERVLGDMFAEVEAEEDRREAETAKCDCNDYGIAHSGCPVHGRVGHEVGGKKKEHETDSDCTLDDETGTCTGCGVDHSGEPCSKCGGKGYHKGDCAYMIFQQEEMEYWDDHNDYGWEN